MKKIPSLFERDWQGNKNLVTEQVVPGCEWVVNGEGMATRKWDGTACKIENGQLWRRYDAKHGKTPPPDFVPAMEPDKVTGHWVGWLPVDPTLKQNRWFAEALVNDDAEPIDYEDGTYELCGPKVNGNPEKFNRHVLIKHGNIEMPLFPRTYDDIKGQFFADPSIEGVVWHHPDGRMCKIKARDFGYSRT